MKPARSSGLLANRKRLTQDFDALARIGRALDTGGLDREAYSAAHAEAQTFVLSRARDAGLEARIDAIGNVVGRTRRGSLPIVMTGSHLDTVRQGGAYDGAVGVIGALEAVRRIVETDVPIQRTLEVVAFAEEEGRFTGLLGSAAMLGMIGAEQLRTLRDQHGVRLSEALTSVSLDLEHIEDAKRDPRELKAFVELHIEQGPVLHKEGIPIGVVTHIAGTYRLVVHLTGRADHAGATPMTARKDPMLAAARIIQGVRAAVGVSGRSTARGTVAVLDVQPNVSSVVAESVRLVVDIRDTDEDARGQLVERIREAVREACVEDQIEWRTENPMAAPPGPTDLQVQGMIRGACERLGLAYKNLMSGASHDAQNFAKLVPTGMIFVPSRDGRSHSPAEYSDPEDIARGVDVLIDTLVALAK